MSEWKPINKAPKDGTVILVWGKPKEVKWVVRFTRHGMHTAYWDQIDQSFCLTGAGASGPFINPKFWQPLPEPPK